VNMVKMKANKTDHKWRINVFYTYYSVIILKGLLLGSLLMSLLPNQCNKKCHIVLHSDGFGSKIFIRAGLGQFFVAWVRSAIIGLRFGFGFGKFPLKITNFSIFCPSDRVKKYLDKWQVGLLFTVYSGRVRAHL